jgi:hypothetical protein
MRNHLISFSISFINRLGSLAFDPVRLSLEAKGAKWFHWLLISGAVVALGCVLEVWETYVSLVSWWHGRSGRPHKENEASWRIPIAALGLVLVILGVIGETVFEGLVSNSDASIRTHESDVLSRAEEAASTANQKAGDAYERASANEREAARLKKEAEDERMKRVELEKQIQPRHLSEKQQNTLVNELDKSRSGGDLTIGVLPHDGEARLYAMDFEHVFQRTAPKWIDRGIVADNFELPVEPLSAGMVPWGITIRCDSEKTCNSANVLAKIFGRAGFQEPPVVEMPFKWDIVVLLIGEHPTVDLNTRPQIKR